VKYILKTKMKINKLQYYRYTSEYWVGCLMQKVKTKGSKVLYQISSSKIYNVIQIDFHHGKKHLHVRVEYRGKQT